MKNETYEEFVEKFKQKKTTDDCYTPPEVYEVIKDWVCRTYNVDDTKIMRPFKPGGNYLEEIYQEGCVVLDNPPFSIFTQICEWYIEKGIKFFLFAPSLTCLSGRKTWDKMNHIICDCDIEYENGARIRTSFVTNLGEDDLILQTGSELTQIVNAKVNELRRKKKKALPKYKYPDCVIHTAGAQKLARYGVDYRVHRKDCTFVRKLDAQNGKAIFGGGLLLSKKAAAERAAAERAAAERAAAERAAAERFELSEREKQIVQQLG